MLSLSWNPAVPARSVFGPTVVTIGNFDGCHLGHQALLRTAVTLAADHREHAVAATFAPHPEVYFGRLSPDSLLFTQRQKTQSFAEMGIDAEVVQVFDDKFCEVHHRRYRHEFLEKTLHCRQLVCGPDFRFGRDRLGDVQYLQIGDSAESVPRSGSSEGGSSSTPIGVTTVRPTLTVAGVPASSTGIRQCLQNGEIDGANAQLGRPYSLTGTIVSGAKRGRTIGFPTANFGHVAQLVPARGVYATRIVLRPDAPLLALPADSLPAVSNIGFRPTIEAQGVQVVETHILSDIGKDALYGMECTLYFVARLRGEQRFASPTDLGHQIGRDITQARKIFG